MYMVALVLSVVTWAVVIAVIFSTPTDVCRTVHMLKSTRGKTTPRFSSFPRLSISGANARPVQEAGDLAGCEGFVMGSAAYSKHWLKNATAFVRRNRDLLAQRSVWLFRSGPLCAEASDAQGVALRAASAPKEIRGFQVDIHPRDHQVFHGALDPGRLSDAELSCLKMPATRAIPPEGDFRDWAQIQEWAEGIAQC